MILFEFIKNCVDFERCYLCFIQNQNLITMLNLIFSYREKLRDWPIEASATSESPGAKSRRLHYDVV